MSILNEIKKAFKLMIVYSIGVFWVIFSVCIPLLINILKRKDVFTVKDRSSYEQRLYTECSDFARHKTLTLDDKNFHYVEVGDESKPLVLFLHGFPQFWYCWRNQLRGLQDMDYHLVAVDMRGAGGSYKPQEIDNYNVNLLLADVRGIIQKLSPNGRAACLVGHDWGALIAWQAAAQSWEWDQFQDQSGYIDKLVILNGPHVIVQVRNFISRLTDVFHYRNLKSLIINPISTLDLSWKKLRPCIDQFLGSFYVFIFKLPKPVAETWLLFNDVGLIDMIFLNMPKELVSDDDKSIYKAFLCEDDHASLTGGLNYYRSNAASGFFEDQKRRGIKQPGFIGVPTLVIWGEKDVALNKDLGLLNLDSLVSNLNIVRFPESDHFIQESNPDKVNNLMRKFITSQKNFNDLDENTE